MNDAVSTQAGKRAWRLIARVTIRVAARVTALAIALACLGVLSPDKARAAPDYASFDVIEDVAYGDSP